ncbi:MAG: acyl-ACP desaturase [Polyangiaceae bacterium]|nr:acyl-ACP desaturase [Polyangiaceae bacterium]
MGIDLDRFLETSAQVDLADVAWHAVPERRLHDAALRTVRYFQLVESSTLHYVRVLTGTSSWRDPELSSFVTAWLYEEEFHGRAFRRFLRAYGDSVPAAARPAVVDARSFGERFDELGQRALSRFWPGAWPAVHMVWGAIQELTTYHAYRALGARAGHPELAVLCERIGKQELRHFAYYYREAERRLGADAHARRVVSTALRIGWRPVGLGMSAPEEARHALCFLFDGAEGTEIAAIEARVRLLPGLEWFDLFGAWVTRHGVGRAPRDWLAPVP